MVHHNQRKQWDEGSRGRSDTCWVRTNTTKQGTL